MLLIILIVIVAAPSIFIFRVKTDRRGNAGSEMASSYLKEKWGIDEDEKYHE